MTTGQLSAAHSFSALLGEERSERRAFMGAVLTTYSPSPVYAIWVSVHQV